MRYLTKWRVLMVCAVLAPIPAWADLYSAADATEKKEFEKAFELYRELAEMGQPDAQENLAVMYVNGEGVKRDNVLGYAWAAIALENGGGEAAKGIVKQLEAHLTDTARARVAELQSRFGHEALQKTLLPRLPGDFAKKDQYCRLQAVGDPDNFYPVEARKRGITGEVLMEAEVYGDGRAHDPRAWYSFPPRIFINAGRAVALYNRAIPHVVDGATIPCTLRYKVKFSVSGRAALALGSKDDLDEVRMKAEGGDPRAQLTYAMVIEGRQDLVDEDQHALPWYLKAAQAGIPAAQYVVGARTLAGFGLEKDERKGLAWLEKAAGAGNAGAQLEVANYLLRKSADAKAVDSAQALLQRAVEGGSLEARFYLAAVLATGADVAQRNPARALELIELAKSDFGMNPIWSEIRAAAYAAQGDFEKAQKDQSSAVRAAKRLGWNTAPQNARLADYAANKAWTGNLFAFY